MLPLASRLNVLVNLQSLNCACVLIVADEYADETCTVDAVEDIERTPAGYQLKIQLPSVFFKYIIGRKGETKKRLESETRTQIKIPRQHEEGDIGNMFLFGCIECLRCKLLLLMCAVSVYQSVRQSACHTAQLTRLHCLGCSAVQPLPNYFGLLFMAMHTLIETTTSTRGSF